jgi:hypothetical protein
VGIVAAESFSTVSPTVLGEPVEAVTDKALARTGRADQFRHESLHHPTRVT